MVYILLICLFFILLFFIGEDLLYIRPNDQFELSENPVDWKNIDISGQIETESFCFSNLCSPNTNQSKMSYIMLKCLNKTDKTKSFNIKVRGDKFNVLFEDSERLDNNESYIYNIRLLPFVLFKNLLPYSIEFSYTPANELIKLEHGEELNLSYVVFGKTSMCLTL